MKPPQAQLFLEVVVLDAIRSDISQNKKLNPQYYECLKKALFRPSAFFKGLIFPMLDVCLRPSHTCMGHYVFTELVLDWLHITRSRDRGLDPCEKEGARAALLGCTHAHRGDGLFR